MRSFSSGRILSITRWLDTNNVTYFCKPLIMIDRWKYMPLMNSDKFERQRTCSESTICSRRRSFVKDAPRVFDFEIHWINLRGERIFFDWRFIQVFARREALVACASPESRCESIFEVDGFSCNNWIFSFQHSYASPKLIENFFCLFYESQLQFGLLLNESKLRAKFDPIRRFSSTKKQKEIVIRKVGTLICFISVSQIRVW